MGIPVRCNHTDDEEVRVLADGEPELIRATVLRQGGRDTWLRAELRVRQPSGQLRLVT